MQGTKAIIGTYNTMPDGASSSLFELTYQSSWRPFLSSLYKFQNIAAVLYYSGTILQWIEENHPEFLILLEEMTSRKQVELLGGGFFSPLLSALQPADKVGQIEMLTTYLRKTFGKRPLGGWVYEYSWDENLPQIFRNAGLEYSFLPAKKLVEAGLLSQGSLTPLITEDQRKLLYIFPVLDLEDEFAEPVPFESALETLVERYPGADLYTIMVNGQSVPWMWNVSGVESPDVLFEKSFAWFQKNCLYIETLTTQTYARTMRAGGPPVYLSTCASSRLCRGFQQERRDVGAGGTSYPKSPKDPSRITARQLIVQNEFSRKLYDKMYYVNALIALLRGDKARKKSAQEDLWKAQSGDAYWEGRLGGIRRPEVRMGAYRDLIEAEKTTRVHGSFVPGLILDDIDCDGQKELLYQAADFNCYVHEKGASVFELDSFRTKQNFCSVYTAEGNAGLLNSFSDQLCETGGFGTQRVNLESCVFAIDEKDKSIQKVVFSREVPMFHLSLKKSYLFQKHCISVDYEIVNAGSGIAAFRFATRLTMQFAPVLDEVRFSLARGRETKEIPLCDGVEAESLDSVRIECQQAKNVVELRSDNAFAFKMQHRLDHFASPDLGRLRSNHIPDTGLAGPARCGAPEASPGDVPEDAPNGVAESHGAELFYQGTDMLFGWDLEIPPDATRNFSLSFHLSN